jgi:hypothetical protein
VSWPLPPQCGRAGGCGHASSPPPCTNSGLDLAACLCICFSACLASILCGAQSGGGGPDVVWRWQQEPAAVVRHGSTGIARGQVALRRRLLSTR